MLDRRTKYHLQKEKQIDLRCRTSYNIPLMMIVLLFGWLSVTACQSSDAEEAEIQLELSVSPDPPKVGIPSTLNISMADSTGKPVAGAELSLEATMTHPGMAPVSATAEEVSPGDYSAEIEFTMAGDWFVIVNARLESGASIERNLPLPAVQPPD